MNISVDYDAIAENARLISDYSGKKIFAVVKNNAYNFGLHTVVKTLLASGVEHFAVASSCEAVSIKKSFPQAYVLQLNPATAEEIHAAKNHGIALVLGSSDWLKPFVHTLSGIELHLKINVGMNRFGYSDLDEASDALLFCEKNRLNISGFMTHFPLAEEKDPSLGHNSQIDKFFKAFGQLSRIHSFKYIHSENSAALLKKDPRLNFCNFSRPGIMLFGYSPTKPQPWLRQSLYASAHIIEIRKLKKGHRLGYGTSYSAPDNLSVAVIDAGYGDGLMRLRKEAPVVINGNFYPIIGDICMSHMFAEIDEHVNLGDSAEIYGKNIPIDYLSSRGIITNSEQTAALHIDLF